jgi:hypothetical protein
LTQRQTLQDFPDTSQVLLHKNNTINVFITAAENDVYVTDAIRFISERAAFSKCVLFSSAYLIVLGVRL